MQSNMSLEETPSAPPPVEPTYENVEETVLEPSEPPSSKRDPYDNGSKLSDFSRGEFLELVGADKVRMLEMLAAEMMLVGYQAAIAQAVYHRAKITGADREELAEATAMRNMLDVQYDTLKHVTSAIQSALKVERLGLYSDR